MGTQPSRRNGAQQPPLFGPCLLWPNGRPSQQLLSSCFKSLPFYLLLEQRKFILWMKTPRSINIVLQTLSGVNYHEFLALCSKYDIDVSSVSEHIIKKAVWNVFAQTVDIWIWFLCCVLFLMFLCFVFYFVCLQYNVCCLCGVINNNNLGSAV